MDTAAEETAVSLAKTLILPEASTVCNSFCTPTVFGGKDSFPFFAFLPNTNVCICCAEPWRVFFSLSKATPHDEDGGESTTPPSAHITNEVAVGEQMTSSGHQQGVSLDNGSDSEDCTDASSTKNGLLYTLRLAEYNGKPLTTLKRYSYYGGSSNPMNTRAEDDNKFELQHDKEVSFAEFVDKVGREDRWSVNVGWEKDRYNTEYASKHIALYGSDNEDKTDEIHLLQCIEKIMEEETLEDGEDWYCSNCKELRKATKKFDLWRAPDVLIVHLKRFQYAQGALFVRRNKLDNLVNFPVEGLDLTKCVKGPSDKSHVYDLFAVSEHIGGMGGGHYTAQCKNYRDGEWYNCNDSQISSAEPSDAVTPKAYVLFYKRRGGGMNPDALVPEDSIVDPATDRG